MTIDSIVLALSTAGVAASLALASQVHPYWLWLAVFLLANLARSTFGGVCPQVAALARLGFKPGKTFHWRTDAL